MAENPPQDPEPNREELEKKMHILNAVRKDDDKVSVKFDLTVNGDYHLIHQYNPQSNRDRVMRNKLSQLNTWLTLTFKHGPPPPDSYSPMVHAGAINDSEHQENLTELVKWLLDPKDN